MRTHSDATFETILSMALAPNAGSNTHGPLLCVFY